MTTIITIFLLGALAYALFYRYVLTLFWWAVRLVVVVVAWQATMLIAPIEINWRGFWASAGLGIVPLLMIGGFIFAAGWNARVLAQENDDKDRARQKAIKDRL